MDALENVRRTPRISRNMMLGLALICVLLIVNVFWPSVWFSSAVTGVVRDAGTNRPIAQATVVAIWTVMGGLAQIQTIGAIQAREVQTDANGVFRIPGWGPRFNFGFGALYQDQPLLVAMHPAYLPSLSRKVSIDNVLLIDRDNEFSVELGPIDRQAQLADQLRDVRPEIYFAMGHTLNCRWGAIPRTRELMFSHYGTNERGSVEGGPFLATAKLQAKDCVWIVDVFGGVGQ